MVSLHESVASDEKVAGIAQGLDVVKLSIASVLVEHEVRMMNFKNWLERKGARRESLLTVGESNQSSGAKRIDRGFSSAS
jgi:hypothetical protein